MTVLDIDKWDRWALLTMNRPDRHNALSVELRDAVSDALDELADDDGVHGVAITGAGRTFSAGWDLGEFERAGQDPELAARIWTSGDRFHQHPADLPAAAGSPR